MHDAELDELRIRVDCRLVLERAGWKLDARESTRRAAKYRDGSAGIIIVTHEGRGWFDPLGEGRGDVLALAQRVWGGNLGHARKALRPLAGLSPSFSPYVLPGRQAPALDAAAVWGRAQPVALGSRAWRYLTRTRGIPEAVVNQASGQGLLREGVAGTAWALHHGRDGQPCGWEMRGPAYKGFSAGGRKALFVLGDATHATRIAVVESAVDALSLAALEGCERTAYVSTAGGFGPAAVEAFGPLLRPDILLVLATDSGRGGDLLAARLSAMAVCAGVTPARLVPLSKDWNEELLRASAREALHRARPPVAWRPHPLPPTAEVEGRRSEVLKDEQATAEGQPNERGQDMFAASKF